MNCGNRRFRSTARYSIFSIRFSGLRWQKILGLTLLQISTALTFDYYAIPLIMKARVIPSVLDMQIVWLFTILMISQNERTLRRYTYRNDSILNGRYLTKSSQLLRWTLWSTSVNYAEPLSLTIQNYVFSFVFTNYVSLKLTNSQQCKIVHTIYCTFQSTPRGNGHFKAVDWYCFYN